jgi:hypothetical protein
MYRPNVTIQSNQKEQHARLTYLPWLEHVNRKGSMSDIEKLLSLCPKLQPWFEVIVRMYTYTSECRLHVDAVVDMDRRLCIDRNIRRQPS